MPRYLSNLPPEARSDLDQCVESLRVKHRYKPAVRRLLAAGSEAVPALQRGLHHASPKVRIGCLYVLDFCLEDEVLPDLIENLEHPDAGVRARALHTLACDRCKEGACRPAEQDVLPVVLRLLRADPSRRVRTQAVDLLGAVVHRHPDVQAALIVAHEHDPHPMVRKAAGWHIPGGARYERTKPRSA